MKKILSLILTLAMLLSFSNIPVFAEGEMTETELATALANGGTVTLTSDVNVTSPIEIAESVEVILDLAGYDIIGNFAENSTTNHIYVINNYGDFTVMDSSEEESGAIISRGIYNYGKMTLESGTIDACDGNGGYAVNNKSGSSFIMNGGTVSASNEDGDAPVAGCYDATALDVPSNCTTILNGGTITNVSNFTYAIASAGTLNIPTDSTIEVSGAHGAISISGGVTTIDAGTFKCNGVEEQTDNIVYITGGELNINGGTFVHEGMTVNANSGAAVVVSGTEPVVNITDGDFAGLNGTVSGNDNTTITGGSYECLMGHDAWANIEDYVAEGAVVTVNDETLIKNEDSTTTTVVVKVGNSYYATLDEAIANATAVDGVITYTLLGDVDYTVGTDLAKGASKVIINGDGKLNMIGSYHLSLTATGAELELDGITVYDDRNKNAEGSIDAWEWTYIWADASKWTNKGVTFNEGVFMGTGNICIFTDCIFDYIPDEKLEGTEGGSHYMMFIEGDADVTVTGCEFKADNTNRAIKICEDQYGTDAGEVGTLTVSDTTFANTGNKPAIVLTQADSVTLSGNIYPTEGVFELDADGEPNGTTVTADITDIACKNDNLTDCGVLVDGKIYTTITDAATVATSGSKVTLFYATTEEVELAEGVTLDTNGYTAENVTVYAPTPAGDITKGYVTANYYNSGKSGIFGQADNVVGTESFVVKLYSDEILVGTATLIDTEKVLLNGVSKSITWHILTEEDDDAEWWDTEWVTTLNVNSIPDKVELYVDDVKVSEGAVELNNTDLSAPICAAVTDANGNVQSLVAGTGYLNGTGANAPVYDEAFQNALNAGGNIVLLRDVTLTEKITVNNNATLNLNGKTITTSGIVGSRVIVLEDQCMTFVINANGGAINSADAQAYGIIDNVSCADVTINGGTYDFDTNNGGLFKFRSNMGTFTLNDITVETNAQISGPSGGSLQELVVNGGTFKAANDYNVRNVFAFYVEDAKATFDNVTITNEYIGAIECSGGEVTVNDCNISVTGTNSAPYLSCAVAVSGGGKVTVDGGTYTTKPTAASDANGQGNTHGSWTAIIMSSGGTMIINDGAFSNNNYGDTEASNPRGLFSIGADADYGDNVAANLQINGGTFNSIGAFVDCETIWGSETDSANTYMPTMGVTITGGDFTGVAGKTIGGCDPISTGNPVDIEISGGTYGTNNSIDNSYLTEGFMLVENADGSYNVEDAPTTGLSGTGTAEDPYLINNLEELKWFRDDVNNGNSYSGKYILLTDNIDLTEIESWTPIGNSTNKFSGHFDGGNKTISNLKINSTTSYIGLFGYTTNGSVKNLKFYNADIDGRLGVGVVAGCPYTSDFDNIEITGKVTIDACFYVGGAVGRNAYGDLTNITINVSEDSYVKANSVENEIAYRTYVGGVVGFMGEGNQTVKNVTSNINVIGSTVDVGGIAGIAHYGNTFENVSCTGNVTLENADSKTDAMEIGGIAGVWHNGGSTVTFKECTYTGELSSTYTDENGETVELTNTDFANGGLIGSAYSADGTGKMEIDYAAYIGTTLYESLAEALTAAALGTGNVTVEILRDIDLSGVDWNPVTVSAPGYPMVTVNGNEHTITGLNDMLFAGTWAGKSGLVINDLTIKDSNIAHDVEDTEGTVGVGAFIGYPQASTTVTLNNCHLVNSTVNGGHWTGGLIGMAGGYNGNDGPVFMNLTITGCSVTDSTITGKGSVGGVIGHGSCAAWTNVVIEDTTISGNTITSTGSSTVKAGAVMGTIGAAGQETTADGETKTGGAFVSATVSDNTVTSNGTTITTIYGRQGTETGVLTVNGGTYDSYPIEENVSYAKPAEGYTIVKNEDGTYGVAKEEKLSTVVGVLRNYTPVDRNNGQAYRVKFYAGIDSLNYAKVGYEFKVVGYETVYSVATSTVYEKINITVNGVTTTYLPQRFASDANYIYALNVYVPTSYGSDATLEVRPYAVTYDNNKIYGEWQTTKPVGQAQ